MTSKISIIIVNYNVAEYIEKLLASIYDNVKNDSFEIIVIDNNSTERSIESLRESYPEVKLILSPENLGFSGGNNAAAGLSTCDYLLFLNPDTLLEEDCINPLIDELVKNPEIAMATPLLKYGNGTFQSSYGLDRGIFVETIDAIYLTRFPYIILKKFGMYLRSKLRKPFFVNWISGAFIIMRRDLFEKIGGFDIEYPLNYEDMDLCKKVLHQGLKIMVDPRHYCIHYESKSQRKNYYSYVYKRYVSKLVYLRKFSSPFQRTIIKNVHIFGLYLRLALLFTVRDNIERSDRKKAFEDSLKLYQTNGEIL